MDWKFDVEYKSGRKETLTTTSGAKAREIRKDLERMQQGGVVSLFAETTSGETQKVGPKHVRHYLSDSLREEIAIAAKTNKRSFSAEVAARVQA